MKKETLLGISVIVLSFFSNSNKSFAQLENISGADEKPDLIQSIPGVNPISIPFQNNTVPGIDEYNGSQNIFSQNTKTEKKSFFKQDNLTGDWWGARSWLNKNGITILPRVSVFYEGLVGGTGSHKFEFGGKADMQLILNGEKLGLWKGIKLINHIEYNFGNSINGEGGNLLPTNTALFFPGIDVEARFDVTSLFFTHDFGTNKTLMIGKINMVDVASSNRFSGGAGIDNFENISFAAPPTGLVPPYIFGSIFQIKTKPLNYTFAVYDPQSVVNKSVFEDPFGDGVTFFSSFEKPVKINGMPGVQGIKIVYSTQNGISLSNYDDIIISPNVSDTIVENSRFYFGYTFNQYLFKTDAKSDKGFGIFGSAGISDGDPTPIDWSFTFGLGGNSPIKNRIDDEWGIGIFYYSFSNGLKESVKNLKSVSLNDERGFECFYVAQIFPWFKLGFDMQVINPAVENNETVTTIGFRSIFKI